MSGNEPCLHSLRIIRKTASSLKVSKMLSREGLKEVVFAINRSVRG
jgi:hypothetical protein